MEKGHQFLNHSNMSKGLVYTNVSYAQLCQMHNDNGTPNESICYETNMISTVGKKNNEKKYIYIYIYIYKEKN